MVSVFMLLYDACMNTKTNIANYNKFRKYILGIGYEYVQNSIYVKFNYKSKYSVKDELSFIKHNIPKTIKVMIFEMTGLNYNKILLINDAQLPKIEEGNVLCF